MAKQSCFDRFWRGNTRRLKSNLLNMVLISIIVVGIILSYVHDSINKMLFMTAILKSNRWENLILCLEMPIGIVKHTEKL